MSELPPPPPPPPSSIPPPPGVPYGYQPYQYAAQATYSGWGTRIGAYLLRAVPSMVFYVPIWIATFTLTATSTTTTSEGFSTVKVEAPGVAFLVLAVVCYGLALTVQVRMMIQRAHLGYDFGDAVVGQRLVRESTMQPMGSGWSVFGRWMLHIVDALPCYAGFFAPLWTAKKQTFADSILKTVVLTAQPSVLPKDLVINSLQIWKPVRKA